MIGDRRGPAVRRTAVWQALFVTFLWSTSWVLIKWGLTEIPALTFAGLRYGIAFFLLLILGWQRGELRRLRQLRRAEWGLLLLLGLIFYAFTQGAQFVSLAYLPAVTVNLLLGFTPALVAVWSALFLAERPRWQQWGGIWLAAGGILLYFWPLQTDGGAPIGWIAAVVGLLANSVAAILGRYVNQQPGFTPLLVTLVSMGSGALLLLGGGLRFQGLPALPLSGWLIILWLAGVNTAFAFTLWNQTLRTLTAVESSMINNSMGVQIPVLAIIFLGERLTLRSGLGLAIAVLGIFVVQFYGRRRKN